MSFLFRFAAIAVSGLLLTAGAASADDGRRHRPDWNKQFQDWRNDGYQRQTPQRGHHQQYRSTPSPKPPERHRRPPPVVHHHYHYPPPPPPYYYQPPPPRHYPRYYERSDGASVVIGINVPSIIIPVR